jgi:DNA-binding transcriptional ArsR family regulator
VSLNPSDIAALVGRYSEPGLLIVPAATPAARAATEAAGWSWLVDDGQRVAGVLQIGSHRIALEEHNPASRNQPRRVRPGRVPWGALTLVRRLIERPYATQRELASLVGISQPRVSQALRVLADQQLVERSVAGWRVRDFDQLVRWWLDSYPGPGGFSTFWYGLDQPAEQARRVLGVLDRGVHPADPPFTLVFSGDVAADLIAPWRSPNRAVVYARTGDDLTEAGLTPTGEENATLELVVPQDPGVWPLPPKGETQSVPGSGSLPLADPLQILWDLAGPLAVTPCEADHKALL